MGEYDVGKMVSNMKLLSEDDNKNKILGNSPNIINSDIIFNGSGNVIFFEDKVNLVNSRLLFDGNNSVIYLKQGNQSLNINIYNDSVCHMGQHNYYQQPLRIILAEQKNCFIGDNCLFSSDITIRNSDAHLLYDCESKKRINLPKSVCIGDHVWIGQGTTVLKGTMIDSGSVIGARSVVAGKSIKHNTSWAGNPARNKKSNIFWDSTCVNWFLEKDTELSMDYSEFLAGCRDDFNDDFWIYEFKKEEELSWKKLEEDISHGDVIDKCNALLELGKIKMKNRFVHM